MIDERTKMTAALNGFPIRR